MHAGPDPTTALCRDAPGTRWGISPATLDVEPLGVSPLEADGLAPPLRLCACCARTALPSLSPYASFFCRPCGARVIELNRSAERLVIPVAEHPSANCALFAMPDDDVSEACGVDLYTPGFARQLDHLESWRRVRTREVLLQLGVGDGTPVDLERFVAEAAALRTPALSSDAAHRALVGWFAEYLYDTPDVSPRLDAYVTHAASRFVRRLPERERNRLRYARRPELEALARAWARRALDSLLPTPSAIDFESPALAARRAPTERLLTSEVLRHLVGLDARAVPPRLDIPPRIERPPREFTVAPFTAPEDAYPDWLPKKRPPSARLVVAIEGAPAPLIQPVTHLYLSMDSHHRWWILWAEWAAPDGATLVAPAGFGPRRRLADVEAAYLTLEVFLGRMRARRGLLRPPRIALTGILGERLVADLLARLWPPDRQATDAE